MKKIKIMSSNINIYIYISLVYNNYIDSFCGLVVRVPGYRSRGPGSISFTTRFSEKQWVCKGVHSVLWVPLRRYLKEKVAAPV
jgi:hypothetical protein